MPWQRAATTRPETSERVREMDAKAARAARRTRKSSTNRKGQAHQRTIAHASKPRQGNGESRLQEPRASVATVRGRRAGPLPQRCEGAVREIDPMLDAKRASGPFFLAGARPDRFGPKCRAETTSRILDTSGKCPCGSICSVALERHFSADRAGRFSLNCLIFLRKCYLARQLLTFRRDYGQGGRK